MSTSAILHLTGTPGLRLSDGTPIELRQKAYAIAALLYLEYHDRTRRSVMAEKIWETSKPEQAMTNLRQALLQTRANCDPHKLALFHIDNTTIALNADLQVDLRELGRIRTVDDGAELERLVSLYHGDLLDGLDDFGPELTQWLHTMRGHVEDNFIRNGTEAALRIGPSSLPALSKLAERLPYSEEVTRAQIILLKGIGNTATATLVLNQFTARMTRDLGAEPSADMRRLLEPEPAIKPVPAIVAGTIRHPDEAPPPRRGPFIPRVVLLPPMQDAKQSNLPRHVAPALIEDITIRLTRLKSVSVIAPHTAWQMDPFSALDEVRAHQIDYGVESRVAPDLGTGGVAVGIRLVRTTTREIVWAEKFVLSTTTSPEVYWDFANGVARSLGDSIEAAELAQERTARDADAYGFYLDGRHHLRTFDLPKIRRGRKSLRIAREIEPEEASIESALARSYVVEWVLRSGSDRALLDKARLHAERAVTIDHTDGTAYRELGRVALFTGDLDLSIEHMQRAARLAPHHADILADYSDTLTHYSDFDAAEQKIEEAIRLNPLPPDEYFWTWGGISFFRGRWEQSISQLTQMRNIDPALRLLAASAAMAGHADLARKYRLRALELQPDFTIARWISRVPQKDPADVDLYIEALKRAGFK